MVIPKGRKFKFVGKEDVGEGLISKAKDEYTAVNAAIDKYKKAVTVGGFTEEQARDIAGNGYLDVKEKRKALKNSDTSIVMIPQKGYQGNAYISTDISLTATNVFSSPLEGLLDGVPSLLDAGMRATTGVSIKSNRATSMKYWVNSTPMSQDITFNFETQVDSFYDVYLPSLMLLWLACPGQNSFGFFTPPIPTLRLFAKYAANIIEGISEDFSVEQGSENKDVIISAAKALDDGLKTFSGFVKEFTNSIKDSGYRTTLYIGNNFCFEDIYIKEVTPSFSTELTYAPLYFLTKKFSKFKPNNLGDATSKAISQTLGAILATGNNIFQAGGSFLQKFGSFASIPDMPAFPSRAEVTVSFDMPFPLTKNGPGSVASVFRNTTQSYKY